MAPCKKEVFLEKLAGVVNNEEREKEANEFAARLLIPPAKYERWVAEHTFFDEQTIVTFAQEIGIHPGIVVGRLQFDGKLKPAYQNGLKTPVKLPLNCR
jgi:HTH-type transcriptional regulator/antitoxin HigA